MWRFVPYIYLEIHDLSKYCKYIIIAIICITKETREQCEHTQGSHNHDIWNEHQPLEANIRTQMTKAHSKTTCHMNNSDMIKEKPVK